MDDAHWTPLRFFKVATGSESSGDEFGVLEDDRCIDTGVFQQSYKAHELVLACSPPPPLRPQISFSGVGLRHRQQQRRPPRRLHQKRCSSDAPFRRNTGWNSGVSSTASDCLPDQLSAVVLPCRSRKCGRSAPSRNRDRRRTGLTLGERARSVTKNTHHPTPSHTSRSTFPSYSTSLQHSGPLRRRKRVMQPQTDEQRGKRACALTARGSISKAMKDRALLIVAETGPPPSSHGARVLGLIPRGWASCRATHHTGNGAVVSTHTTPHRHIQRVAQLGWFVCHG